MRKRRDVRLIEKSTLSVHLDYDYLTVGELGNMLIRLQSALRSLAGLAPGEYAGKFRREQPRFVASSVITKESIDIQLLLTILFFAAEAPMAISHWSRFASEAFRRLKMAIVAIIRGTVDHPETDSAGQGIRIDITRGEIDLRASRQFTQEELSEDQRRKVTDLIGSLMGPANRVVIGDEESEVTIYTE
jgi:hypothetical protein